LDISPFHHVRHRESYWYNDYDEVIKENLECYENACQGRSGIWCDSGTYFNASEETGGQEVRLLDWSRGGVFDFYEESPSCDERAERLVNMMKTTASDGREQLIEDFGEIQRHVLRHRSVSSLFIDESKLIICTGYEVAVLPFSLRLEDMQNTIPEEWDDNEVIVDNGGNAYQCDKNTTTWHSFRPLDNALFSRWNHIRSLSRRDFYPLADEDRQNNPHTITTDLAESFKRELALMKTVEFGRAPCMFFPCISWKYLAVASSSLSRKSSDDDCELLHVFDALAGWPDSGSKGYATAEGIHFKNVEENPSESGTSDESD